MNFYMGLSIEELNYSDYNVRIDEDVLDKLFYNENLKFQKIYEIDPYDDTVLYKDDVLLLINDCDLLINAEIEIKKEFIEAIKNLKILCQNAISENKNIICIGD